MAKPIKIPLFLLHILIIFVFLFDSSISLPLSDCLVLHKISNFTLRNSSNYAHFLRFSLQNVRASGQRIPKPTALILPETKEQLIHCVTCCRRSSLDIVIRCGGHSYEGLSSMPRGKNPFVIVDMMNLNRVTVDLVSKTAWVEGGATLGELYYAIAEHSSSHGFPAGVGPTVGVGGHFGGGGIGVLGRKYGLSADNVVDVVLIDALRRELSRPNLEEDVFWAVRGGGGGSWGIVYAWKVKLVEVPARVTCLSISKQGTNNELAQLIHKWQYVGPNLDDGFHLSVYLTASATNQAIVTFNGFYLGSRTEAISIINQCFPDLEIPEEAYLEMSWIESVSHFSGLPKGSTIHDLKSRYWAEKSYTKVKSDYVKKPITMEGLKGALDMVALEPKGLVILDPYGGVMDRISSDSIPFPHRKGNLYNILYAAFWGEEEEEDRCLGWVRGFYDYMTPFVSSNPRGAYVNYVDLDLGTMDLTNVNGVQLEDNAVDKARAWGEKYFLANYDRLVKAKTIIDPQNVFNHRQGIPPFPVHFHDEL
uniref:FAD-binding PCMH-type domain-containing protein n=1 Tax=Opuntia streptacantha TaxID=393608 RepID=A0A7C8ZF95_OPUST